MDVVRVRAEEEAGAASVGSVVNGRVGGLDVVRACASRPPAAVDLYEYAELEPGLLNTARSVCVSDLGMEVGVSTGAGGLVVVMANEAEMALEAAGGVGLGCGCGVDSFELLAEAEALGVELELAANARMAKSGEERAVFLFA